MATYVIPGTGWTEAAERLQTAADGNFPDLTAGMQARIRDLAGAIFRSRADYEGLQLTCSGSKRETRYGAGMGFMGYKVSTPPYLYVLWTGNDRGHRYQTRERVPLGTSSTAPETVERRAEQARRLLVGCVASLVLCQEAAAGSMQADIDQAQDQAETLAYVARTLKLAQAELETLGKATGQGLANAYGVSGQLDNLGRTITRLAYERDRAAEYLAYRGQAFSIAGSAEGGTRPQVGDRVTVSGQEGERAVLFVLPVLGEASRPQQAWVSAGFYGSYARLERYEDLRPVPATCDACGLWLAPTSRYGQASYCAEHTPKDEEPQDLPVPVLEA